MATQQGLFTQGPSIDDILQKRNQRQGDLQRQLMAQAAQGARDPAKAQAISFLGSSLGRALGGAMGSGDNRKALEAKNEAQQQAQSLYVEAASGTSADMLDAARTLKTTYPEASVKMLTLYQAALKREADTKTTQDDAALAASNLKAEQTADNELASVLVGKVPDNVIKALRTGGDAADEARAFGYKFLNEQPKHSSLAQKVKDAYGYEIGSDKNMEQMQIEMGKSGQTIEVNVNEQGFQELTDAQKSLMQKEIRANKTNLQALDDISDSFDASYFTLQGQGWAKVGAWADKLGISPDTPLVGGAVDYNARKTTAVAQIDMLFNQYRKEITGAAAAVAELEALKKSYLNTDRGPEATLAMIAQLKAVGKRGYEEKKLQLGRGIDLNPAVFDWNDPTTYTQEQLNAAYAEAISN